MAIVAFIFSSTFGLLSAALGLAVFGMSALMALGLYFFLSIGLGLAFILYGCLYGNAQKGFPPRPQLSI